MNKQEQERKAAQKSSIKGSEYARYNLHTPFKNHSFANEENPKKIFCEDLALKVISGVAGVLFFVFIAPLGKFVFSHEFYSGTLYLVLSLIASAAMALVIFNVGRLLIKKWRIRRNSSNRNE